MHDNGEMIGITHEECCETLLVLYHISTVLHAKLEVTLGRLGYEGYSVQLRVTKPQPEAIEPEVDAFINGLNSLSKSRLYSAVKRQRSESAPIFFDNEPTKRVAMSDKNSTSTRPVKQESE